MITVLTWFWRQERGRTAYEPHHVAIWASMVRRNLKQPHRIACVTSEPLDLPGVDVIVPPREFEDVKLPTWRDHRPQCLRRLTMFRSDAARWFGERFVCMDMDCVIAGPLDPLFDTDAEFKMFAGTAAGRPYNGSMILLTAGARAQVYEQFTPEGAIEAGRKYVGSDQAWISQVLGPKEATWGEADGVHWWQGRMPDASPRLLFFPGGMKPWEMIAEPFVAEHYRRDGKRRGLVLGNGRGVWDDAERALERGRFDGVIAYPDAAHYWPGEVEAVAHDRGHAEALARMLGFGSLTFCGA